MLIKKPGRNTTGLCGTKKIRESEGSEHVQMIATLTVRAPAYFCSFTKILV